MEHIIIQKEQGVALNAQVDLIVQTLQYNQQNVMQELLVHLVIVLAVIVQMVTIVMQQGHQIAQYVQQVKIAPIKQ